MSRKDQPLHENVAAHLSECKKYVDAEVYYKALSSIKDAKYADPRNIYVIALEKQVELLSELSKKRTGVDSNKREVRATIPEIIRRAIDDSRNRYEMKQQNVKSGEEDDSPNDPITLERDLAFKKLKNQFVKLAEEFIDRGDYQSALEEIRRIFIIDPENSIAKNLEKKIETLVSYQNAETPASEKQSRKKKKKIPVGKTGALIISLLIVANVLLFYITSLNSSNDASYEAYTYQSQSEYTDAEALNNPPGENQSGSEYTSSSDQSLAALPDAVREYREVVHVVDEPDLAAETDDTVYENDVDDIDTTEMAVDANADQVGSVVPRVIVDTPDDYLQFEEPVYPDEAIELGIEGDVVIRVRFDSTGIVNDSFIETTDHPILSDAALRSARASVFFHSETNQNQHQQWVSIPYQFRIER